MRMTYIVGVYLCNRAYGGPEEGGWWFDTGELCRTLRVFHSEALAVEYIQRMQRHLDRTLNRSRREIGSVLSTGRYYAEIHEDYLPKFYPAVTPHYE